MAMESGDLNSLQVELDLARQPPAPLVAQPPGFGPELSEAVAEETGGGGGVAGPSVVETSYPGVHEGSVLLAPPGFTVCESFFDSGVFVCFNPEVVFGTEVRMLPDGSFSMGDDVWCNVTVEDGRIDKAELATAADDGATVSVHVADIRPDGVKQYHVGAVVVSVVSEGGGSACVPCNFEPVFSVPSGGTGKVLTSVGEGYYPVGRRFYSNSTVSVDSSANIATGYIWLEVTYPSATSSSSSASSDPSATVKGGSSFPSSSAVTDTVSWLPLYKIASGALEIDFRSAMSLTLREL